MDFGFLEISDAVDPMSHPGQTANDWTGRGCELLDRSFFIQQKCSCACRRSPVKCGFQWRASIFNGGSPIVHPIHELSVGVCPGYMLTAHVSRSYEHPLQPLKCLHIHVGWVDRSTFSLYINLGHRAVIPLEISKYLWT